MFCPACQQDVPALAVPEEPGVVRCAYCAEELGTGGIRGQESGARGQESVARSQESTEKLIFSLASEEGSALNTADVFHPDELLKDKTDKVAPRQAMREKLPPLEIGFAPPIGDWDLEPEMKSAERLLKNLRQDAPAVSAREAPNFEPTWPTGQSLETTTAKAIPAAAPVEKSGSLAWSCLSLGVMALACGLVLIVWSVVEKRDDLWSLGLPLALVGQGGLVIGLLLQLEGLWRNSKRTEETLTQLDGKLHDLAHTTTMLGTTRSLPAQSFYVHMAEGASPHLLLADLKGQLDLLAERLARK